MKAAVPLTHDEERATRPLFTARRSNECAWPLWGEVEPLDQKRCCGAPVRGGSKVPYCAAHLRAQRRNPTERSE